MSTNKKCSKCKQDCCKCKQNMEVDVVININLANGGTGSYGDGSTNSQYEINTRNLSEENYEIDIRTGSKKKKKDK